MRRGCIAVSNLRCEECGRTIRPPERYLAIDEKKKDGGKKILTYCVDCSLNKGYAEYKKVEKGERVLTFSTGEKE